MSEEEVLATVLVDRIRATLGQSMVFRDGEFLLSTWHGEKLEHPLVLRFTPEVLESRLTTSDDTRQALFPSRTIEEAGAFLFASSVDEALSGRLPGQVPIHVVEGPRGLVAVSDGPERRVSIGGREEASLLGRVRAYAPLTGETFEASRDHKQS